MKKPHLTAISIVNQGDFASVAELERRLKALRAALDPLASPLDTIVVVNGVSDLPAGEIQAMLARTPDVQVFSLAEEVDRDVAFLAGLESALGDAVLMIDLDSYDVDLFASMLSAFGAGNDVVLVRGEQGRGGLYALLRRGFFGVYRAMTGLDEAQLATQKILSRGAVNYVLQFGDGATLLRTLALRSGFRTEILDSRLQDHRPRSAGSALAKGMRLLTAATSRPMRLASLIGVLGGALNLFYMLYVLLVAIFKADVQQGWVTLSLQSSGMYCLFSIILALLAEYIMQIHAHAVRRPTYYVAAEYRSPTMTRERQLNVVGDGATASTAERATR